MHRMCKSETIILKLNKLRVGKIMQLVKIALGGKKHFRQI